VNLGNLIIDPSLTVAAVGGLAVAALVAWWLKRRRQSRIWLPTVRILRLESRVLPRLVLRPPPLVTFLCFAVLALVATALALRPRTQVFTPFEPNQTRIHIFVDMSPSIAGHVTLGDLAQRVAQLATSLKESGRVTLSTSHGPQLSEPASSDAASEFVMQANVHRSGLTLGTAMKVMLDQLGEVDRLFIVSDRDQYSWDGFNWRYLLDDMDVRFVDIGTPAPTNHFINEARYMSAPTAGTMDWEVEIARRGGAEETDGELRVSLRSTVLAQLAWRLPAGRQTVLVPVSWPASLVEEVMEKTTGDEALVFSISTKGKDALALDNDFRADLIGLKQEVLMISESAGERVLEDPMTQLQISLSVLGFKMRRLDSVRQPGPPPSASPFWIIVGGQGAGVDHFCPKSLEDLRLTARTKQGARDGRAPPTPKVWLLPYALEADYGELCECYDRLLLSSNATSGEPEFCKAVEARSQWLGLLPSLGAKQIGGDVGDATGSIAWHGRDDASDLEVLAFTVPLTPLVATGINHARLPLLVRDLATWQGLIEPSGGQATSTAWPRVADVATTLWSPVVPLPPAEMERMRLSNVPLGESMFAEADVASLPPRWTAQPDWADREMPAKKDREDPLPWLRLAAIIVVAVSCFEAAFLLIWHFTRLVRRRRDAAAALAIVVLAVGFAWTERAEARIEMSVTGYQSIGPMRFSTLAREMAHRTSIELAPEVRQHAVINDQALAEPWLWVRDVSVVSTEGGRLRPDVASWVKRGGFLVIESTISDQVLAALTADVARADPARGGWLPLPPDHELMRSFYLIDALPACNEQIWRGFQYDDRLAILAIPYSLIATVKDQAQTAPCAQPPDQERSVRIMVNLVMVALATDYKKDQIHLPEILKRLR
jgi:hypothetical protein